MYFYTGDSQGENTLEDTVQRNLTFPFLLNEGENCFLLKGLYHPIVKFLALGNMPPRKIPPPPLPMENCPFGKYPLPPQKCFMSFWKLKVLT